MADKRLAIIRRVVFAMVCTTSVLAGCMDSRIIVPPSAQLDQKKSVVGISLRAGRGFEPGEVYFIRLQDGEAITTGSTILVSNYRTLMEGGASRQFYLLNADPGHYIVVACKKAGGYWKNPSVVTFFSEPSLVQTEIVAGEGDIAFMGEYDVNYSVSALPLENQMDKAQQHYQNMIVPNLPSTFLESFVASYLGKRYLSADLDNAHPGQDSGGRMHLTANKEDLRQGAWANVIIERLSALDNREEFKRDPN